MRDLVFGLIWMALVPISFYSAHIGVILWVWVALLSPNDLMYGALGGVPFNKIVAACSLLMLVIGKDPKRFYSDRLIVLIALFGVVVTLSFLTQVSSTSFTDLQYDKFWKQLVLALLITGVLSSRHRLHQAALAVSIAYGFIMAKEGLIFLLTAGGHTINGTPSTGDNNGLALAILMTIPIVLYVARYSADRRVQLACRATAGLGAVTVIATFSRGGFVGLIVLALMLLKSSKYKVRSIVFLAVAGTALYFVAPPEWFERINTIKEASDDSSFVTRLVAWKINFLMALDHPLLGGGPYASLDWQNWTRHLQESTTFLFPTPAIYRTYVAHSIYFQVLGDTGFTGLILFLLILLTAMLMCRRTRRMARNDPSLAWAADLARALEVSIVVYCVAGAALSLIYFELLYVLLALVSRTHQTTLELTASRTAPAIQARQPRLTAARRVTA